MTANLAHDSVLSGRAALGMLTVDRLLAALILVSCITKYPVLVMVMQARAEALRQAVPLAASHAPLAPCASRPLMRPRPPPTVRARAGL